MAYIGVEVPEYPSEERDFSALQGREFKHDGQRWTACEDPEEFADYLEAESERRGPFDDTTRRNDRQVNVRRKDNHPTAV